MDKIIFNNHDLSEVIRIIEVIRPVGNERSVTTNDAPFLGVNVQNLKIGPKKIKVRFAIYKNSAREAESAKHVLAKILNTKDPVRITISDEPDKYYMGLVIGAVDMDNVTRWFQRGEFDILVPDGVAHSTAYKRFDAPRQEGNKAIFDLENNGTVDAYPIVTVKHASENGYIGLVNTSGAMELGSREEADKEDYKKSETLFDYVPSTGLARGQKNVAVLNDQGQNLGGALSVAEAFGRPHISLTNRGSGPRQVNAGSITWDISVDSSGESGSLNDYIWWRQVFIALSANQLGFIKIMVSDSNGHFLYGVETIKRANGLSVEYNLLASNGQGGFKLIKQWIFDATERDEHNPFNAGRGASDLLRRDDMVQAYWWGGYQQFYIPEIKGRKSAKIHVALGAFGDKPLLSHMYLDNIIYRKDFVKGTRDIPNRYRPGSTVVIDSESDAITVDGLDRFSDRVRGSDWIKIPPGTSKLEVYFSSWVKTKPIVSVNFEERWL